MHRGKRKHIHMHTKKLIRQNTDDHKYTRRRERERERERETERQREREREREAPISDIFCANNRSLLQY